MEKFYPEVGTKLYLQQRTGSYYVDAVKTPYTVIGKGKGGKLLVQSCKYTWPVFEADPKWDESEKEYYARFVGTRCMFYDTIPEKIEPDISGDIIALSWSSKKGRWQYDRFKTGYPQIAVFGEYVYFPYLD